MNDEQEKQVPPLTKEQKRAVEEHLRQVRKQLRRNLWKAYRGWWYWRTTLKKYRKTDIKNTAVILMPEAHDRDNYFALRYIDQMLRQHKFRKALILTHSGTVKKSAELFSNAITAVVDCPRKKAEELMQFYCLYNFDKRFFCASLDEPYGRNGSRIIGARGITAEEIFVIGVYRTYPYEQMPPPKYEGDDTKVAEFLKQGDIAIEEAAKSYTQENSS
jgi:hypothetical protein